VNLSVRRVRQLPGRSRDALLAVAALSHPTTSLVDAAHLRSAERAGLIRVGGDARIVFAHPLYASAVYTAAPMDKRHVVHARLSKHISATSTPSSAFDPEPNWGRDSRRSSANQKQMYRESPDY
jgi:hypothetical protein